MITPPAALLESVRTTLAGWDSLRVADLVSGRPSAPLALLLALGGIALVLLAVRAIGHGRRHSGRLVLPAMLDVRRSWLSWLRHAPAAAFVAGVPCFALAIADPFLPLGHTEVSYPGRRIALLIDASSSMMSTFRAGQLNAKAPKEATFFTTVAAAERFLELRMRAEYRDVVALIEFGDEAYVVTPFTNDYDNVLLSLSLIGDWTEFMRFPDQGTTIGQAIEQSVNLFRAFNFLDASGNLMVIFSDGQDSQVTVGGRPVREVLAGAIEAKVPVYFIRTNFDKPFGDAIPDRIWQPAVESTGGRFYAVSDEATMLRAIREIDEMAEGTVSMRQYTTRSPAFAPFALFATGFWSLALIMKVGLPLFRTFP
ncbi:MAG: VWA domain-containing protein [Acidimicrobiia bacterium]|nr:VWA domain-containing protein [Acidimicrobiia bacterium]